MEQRDAVAGALAGHMSGNPCFYQWGQLVRLPVVHPVKVQSIKIGEGGESCFKEGQQSESLFVA